VTAAAASDEVRRRVARVVHSLEETTRGHGVLKDPRGVSPYTSSRRLLANEVDLSMQSQFPICSCSLDFNRYQSDKSRNVRGRRQYSRGRCTHPSWASSSQNCDPR